MPKWKLQHSKSKPAWNIVGTTLGGRYKIARFPYIICSTLSEEWNNKEVDEQKQNALKCIYSEDMFEILDTLENDDNTIPEFLWLKIQDILKAIKNES